MCRDPCRVFLFNTIYMSNLIIKGVECRINNYGVVELNLVHVANGLGFIKRDVKSGVTYERINKQFLQKHLYAFGILDSENEELPEFIAENIFYKLCFKAENETARCFQDLVTDEILPSIRKHGIYATETTIDKILNDPDFGIELLIKLKEERAARIEAEKTVAILTHIQKTYTITEIAKELGLKSAITLNVILKEKGIQFKQNDTWVPYSKYSNLGWFDIKQEVLDSGKIIYHRRITGIGRENILKLLKHE